MARIFEKTEEIPDESNIMLEKFDFSKVEARLITLDDRLYKILVYLKSPEDAERFSFDEKDQEDFEKIIKVVIARPNSVFPIRTDTFCVYPHIEHWSLFNRIKCSRNKMILKVSPFLYVFQIEGITQNCEKQDETFDKYYVPETTENEDESACGQESVVFDRCVIPETDLEDKNSDCFVEETPNIVLCQQRLRRHRKHKGTAKKRKYSVSEYLDKTRHEVIEQDIEEQFRFQDLATPHKENEEQTNRLQAAVGSVKKLMFGSK